MSVLLLLVVIAFFATIYGAEMQAGIWNSDLRLVRDPAQAAMRYIGMSHFLVALFYAATSKRMRNTAARLKFAVTCAAAVAICIAFAKLNAAMPLVAIVAFVGYFMVHDFRDQILFYSLNGDAVRHSPQPTASLLLAIPFFIIGVLFVAVVGVAAVAGAELPIAALAAEGGIVLIAATLVLRRTWGPAGMSLHRLASEHRPILFVFSGVLLVLGASIAAGWQGHAIVILHVVTWYVFTMGMLRARSCTPQSLFQWLRDTPAGFNVLHVGSAVLLLAAGAVWAYSFRNDPSHRVLWGLLSGDNFYYWTIAHVTVSFASPR